MMPVSSRCCDTGCAGSMPRGSSTRSCRSMMITGKISRKCEAGCGRCTPIRSEEHTSELQSLTNLVCRLLLEKKKTIDVGGDVPLTAGYPVLLLLEGAAY